MWSTIELDTSPGRVIGGFDVAKLLGVDVSTLTRWRTCGRGPRTADDRELAYFASDVEEWLDGLGMVDTDSVLSA